MYIMNNILNNIFQIIPDAVLEGLINLDCNLFSKLG